MTWLEFAIQSSPTRLEAEVKDAIKKGRKVPRKDGFSLPNLPIKVNVEFSAEENDLFKKAMNKAAAEMNEALGGGRVGVNDVLLYLSRRILESEPPGGILGERLAISPYLILYHHCPSCLRASLPTADGPVEIPGEVVERVKGCAREVAIEPVEELKIDGDCGAQEVPETKVENSAAPRAEEVPLPERDRPNPPGLVEKVRLRDGLVCANPCCRRSGSLHAHHIQLRGQGGRTVLWNEILLCSICHACLHQGKLSLQGDPVQGIIFRTVCDGMVVDLREEFQMLSTLPEVRVTAGRHVSGAPDFENESGFRPSGMRNYPSWLYEGVLKAMKKIGYSVEKAKKRLERAWDTRSRQSETPREEEILFEAIRWSES